MTRSAQAVFEAEDFEVVETIPMSSIGTSYVGINRTTGVPLLCRVFPVSALKDYGWSFEYFAQFCEKVKALNSPFIVPYDRILKDSSKVYAFRAYISGEPVQKIAVEGNGSKTSQNVLFAMWKVIVRTIVHLHQNDVFPIFLKISSVFIVADSRVVITDLYPVPRMSACFGRDTMFMACLAPEVFNGGQVGKKSDTWMLGVLLVFLMTGRMPWNMKNKFSMVRQINLREFEVFEIPEGIKGIIDRTIVVDPERRTDCERLLNAVPVKTQNRMAMGGKSRTPVIVSQLVGLAKKLPVDDLKSARGANPDAPITPVNTKSLRRFSSVKTPPTFNQF